MWGVFDWLPSNNDYRNPKCICWCGRQSTTVSTYCWWTRIKYVRISCRITAPLCVSGQTRSNRKKKKKKSEKKSQTKASPDEKPKKVHECSFCLKTFASNASLKRHVSIHTGERPYKCNYCGKSFNQKWYCQAHEKIHTKEDLYECDNCDKAFITRHKLKIHERQHRGEKPYECVLCSKQFCTAKSRTIHLVRAHSDKQKELWGVCGYVVVSLVFVNKQIKCPHECMQNWIWNVLLFFMVHKYRHHTRE